MIANGDESWRTYVPDAVAEKIVAGQLFGPGVHGIGLNSCRRRWCQKQSMLRHN
jgi:hypothetical protein